MKIEHLHGRAVGWPQRPQRPLAVGLAAAAFAVAGSTCNPARAAMAPGTTGNGELFVSVFDDSAKISYTLDLGVLMDDFFVWAQQDSGNQRFWTLDDANWALFLGRVGGDTGSNLRWAVMASDSTGGLAPGGQRLFTTLRPSTYVQANTPSNLNLSNGIGAMNTFYVQVNATGTHSIPGNSQSQLNYTVNGSSVNALSDPTITYFGETGGTGPSFNANFVNLRLDNPVGASSWFYYLSRSGVNNGNAVTFDEFDNRSADGYFGLIYVDPANAAYASSPFLGKYLLSYTLTPITLTAQISFAASIGRTEFDGTEFVSRLDGVAATATEMSAATSITRLPGFAATVTAVPEPGTWGLMGLGLAFLAAARKRTKLTGAEV